MSRLIDADALLKKMSGHCDVCQFHSLRSPRCCDCDWHEAMGVVDDMDDAEIKHQDYCIHPVYDKDGKIVMYEVYSENCTKCIERWRVVKE